VSPLLSEAMIILRAIPTSILEYITHEDAERAVKELDGRDLRGRPVRVALDDMVCSLTRFLTYHA
jgi:RNA recognition motif. (a.k.a. RRM, RBD, or RNP domain)